MPAASKRAARDLAGKAVGAEGKRALTVDVARHLIEQQDRGARGEGVGQEARSRLAPQRTVEPRVAAAQFGIDLVVSAEPLARVKNVEPVMQDVSRP